MSTINADKGSVELTRYMNGINIHSNTEKEEEHRKALKDKKSMFSMGSLGKSSVMEKVQNVLCGQGIMGNASTRENALKGTHINEVNQQKGHSIIEIAPEKPGKILNLRAKLSPKGMTNGHFFKSLKSPRRVKYLKLTDKEYFSMEELWMDEKFLTKFFTYFNSMERCSLSQVCTKWRDILYQPKYYYGLTPLIYCKELRENFGDDVCDIKTRFYNSFMIRGFDSMCLVNANDEDLLDLIHNFPASSKMIRSLGLRCSNVSDKGLEALTEHLNSLYQLDLSGCNELTEGGLWGVLNPRIVALSISDCINIADDSVGAIATLLPSLYEFSLQAYHVTDAALVYFSPKQTQTMSILRLHSCWEITNHGIVNIVHALPNLTVLSLSGCSKITDDGIELIAENLRRLRSLDLSWCPRITDAALEYIACDLTQLEDLTLDRCVNVTDIGVGYISTMLSLSALFLRWCSQLRDFGIQHLCTMRNLHILSVAGCPLLTSSGLSSLIQLRHLQELELTNCPGSSPELLAYLREHLPSCTVIE